ncbi:hypothetical protein CTT39_23620 [Agrobacterium rosae]|nr:hypothetical protein CTT39_23620 [Agrobacterium rosae]
MNWTISPYIGVNEFKFGISPQEVVEVIGVSPRIKKNPSGGKRYTFGIDKPFFKFSPTDELEEISFPADLEGQLLIERFDLYSNEEFAVLQQVFMLSGREDTFQVAGFIVFLSLGVAFSGFHDGDKSQKTVVCFRRNLWDRFIPEMLPIEF